MTILFPVSQDPSRDDSFGLALDIARSLSADIRILFVVDRDGIRRIEAGAPIGAIHMAEEAEQEITRREASTGSEIVAALCKRCKDAGVSYTADVKVGDPREEIEKEAARCDLVVSGFPSQFHFNRQDTPGKLVLALMKERIIPIVLAASPHRAVKTAVIACSGNLHLVRAVGAMARLGLWKENCRLILLAVDDSVEEGKIRLAEASRILADEGYPPWEEKVLQGRKVETLKTFCEEAGADAVVLGGWGRHHWDEILGTSVTEHFLTAQRHHLFLYM